MTRLLLVFALALSAVGIGAAPQTKPSFTGTWTIVGDATVAGFICGPGCTMVQDATTLTVTRTGPTGDVKAVYKLDGSESTNTSTLAGRTFSTKAKATWDGAKLSIATVSEVNGQPYPVTTVLSLDATGNLVMERSASALQTQGTKLIYKKS